MSNNTAPIVEVTAEQESRFTEVFNLFDKNKDGTISQKELKDVMTELGQVISDKEVDDMIASVDINKDGVINLTEFMQMMSLSNCDKMDFHVELKEAFAAFDKNSDGVISPDELRKMMKQLGEPMSDEAIDEMVGSLDMNGDGLINFEEFVKMLQ